MRISWDEDMVSLIKANQKGSISWSQTFPEKVAPDNELIDTPTGPGFRNHAGSCSEHRCELSFPLSFSGGAEAAQAQTPSKFLPEYRGDKGSEGRAANDEGCVSSGQGIS